ncbi:MAG: hypothetical protein A2Y84_01675 [Candidatus Colwellbacteria bacterium RBG_13_48_8]|uniref:Uncharacterized protein n=1 Tax=Candidatus Colwellbacteria bacterium RBG_13_48_8 TaxID=1797685 RepID=A0A1G1YWS3_9BACT|nr:MAG: hypothetical protein A2Y84_01675 [Candidatus Colwellbacteria bacterium RBG_13_48_8]
MVWSEKRVVIDEMRSQEGQSLAEIIVAVAIGAAILGSAATALIIMVRSGADAAKLQKGYDLAQKTIDNTRSFAEADWVSFYNLSPDSATSTFHLYTGGQTGGSSVLYASSTATSTTIDGTVYTYWFSAENVNRDSDTGAIVDSPAGIEDPSTQKVTAHVSWAVGTQIKEITVIQYLTRMRSFVTAFTDWSGGAYPAGGPITRPDNTYSSSSGTISTSTTGSITVTGESAPEYEGVVESRTFDTGFASGTTINSITWQGTKTGDNSVMFRIASSNSSTSTWDFKGDDGTSNSYYGPVIPNQPIPVKGIYHNNHRYFRYRIYLSKGGETVGPVVEAVTINWSL